MKVQTTVKAGFTAGWTTMQRDITKQCKGDVACAKKKFFERQAAIDKLTKGR